VPRSQRLSSQEINVGLAADIGTLQRFPKIVGSDSIARELALTGRKFGAEEARQIGFVSRVVSGGRAEVVCKSGLPLTLWTG
jgi:delta(3,5)-delta(2,4)-dienoyl-CoA isomerase